MVKAAVKPESLSLVSRWDRIHHPVTKDRICKAKYSKTGL